MRRSENVGSDSIFVDAFSELNQMHCGEKVRTVSVLPCGDTFPLVQMIQTYGECVYFVAIKGISPQSALAPSSNPVDGKLSGAVLPLGCRGLPASSHRSCSSAAAVDDA